MEVSVLFSFFLTSTFTATVFPQHLYLVYLTICLDVYFEFVFCKFNGMILSYWDDFRYCPSICFRGIFSEANPDLPCSLNV